MANQKILLFENGDPIDCNLPKKLEAEGFSVTSTYDLSQFLTEVDCQKYDVVVLNIDNPMVDHCEILKKIKLADRNLIPLIFTSTGSVESAVEAMKLGCFDYVSKPVNIEVALKTIRHAFASHVFEKAKTKKNHTKVRFDFSDIIGESRAIKEVFKLVEKAAESQVTVLISGESGTGKELIAKAIHKNRARVDKPFIAVNCAAIPETLLESELFGHEEGAFTGAIKRTSGKFEQAHGGTIFLDEIGEMSLATQAKTLRVLQEKEFERVGGNEKVRVDVRIISSTNRDLGKMTKEKTFREDLFYRISVFPIVLPPLRERREDIPLLADHFIGIYAKQLGKPKKELTREVLEFLLDYGWPGNVRELENVIERAMVLSPGDLIDAEHLPEAIKEVAEKAPVLAIPKGSWDEMIRPLKEEEKRILQRAFEILGGNITRVAKELEISRRTLYRKIKEFGMDIKV